MKGISKSPSRSMANFLSVVVSFFCNSGLAVNLYIIAGPFKRRSLYCSTRKSGFLERPPVIKLNTCSVFGLKNTFDVWYLLVAVWGDTVPRKYSWTFPLH